MELETEAFMIWNYAVNLETVLQKGTGTQLQQNDLCM